MAEVMRANGAEEYEADLIEKELPRLNKLAGRCVDSRENSPAASKPTGEKVSEITADIGAKISAHITEQMKALSAIDLGNVNETLKKIQEDINNVRVAVLEKVTDVFCPDTSKNNHRLENAKCQMSDRASQTTMDTSYKPDKAQYLWKVLPQDNQLCQSQGHQLPHMPVQQHRVPGQYSAVRSVKEPDSTAKEHQARQIPSHDPNTNAASRTPALPHDQDPDSAILHLQGENSSPRTPSVLHEQASTGSAKQTNTIICRNCNQPFHNPNSLYRHLRSCCRNGTLPPPLVSPKSTAGSSTKPRAQPPSQRKANPDDAGYPSVYRPSKPTETDRGPPQMDGAQDFLVGSQPDPAAQLLGPETLSTSLEKRVSSSHGGHACEVCHQSFESKKLLYGHLKEEGHLRRRAPPQKQARSSLVVEDVEEG